MPDSISEIIDEVAVIVSSPRGGSSLLAELLRSCPELLHLPGEVTPLLTIAGADPFSSGMDSDILTGEHAQIIGDRLRALLRAEAGVPRLDGVSADNLGSWLHGRLGMQWPDDTFSLDDVRECAESALRACPLPENCTNFAALADFHLQFLSNIRASHPRVNPYYYDLPDAIVARRFPGLPAPAGPPSARLIEVPPFLIARPWRRHEPGEAGSGTLVLKAPGCSYQIPFYRALFPDARLRVLHLTREPAPAINGLIAAWRHRGFFSRRVPIALRITGYSDLYPDWGADWWNFDLPPGWRECVDWPLEKVCAFQWYSAHQSVLSTIAAGGYDVLRVRHEDIVGPPEQRQESLCRIGEWLGLPGSSVRGLLHASPGPVSATDLPDENRWMKMGDIIGPLLRLPEVREVAAELGYRDDPHGSRPQPTRGLGLQGIQVSEVAMVWAEVLGLSEVTEPADFFDLGGNSLLAVQMIGRICERMIGRPLDDLLAEELLAALFDDPGLAAFTAALSSTRAGDPNDMPPPLVPVSRDRPLPASFAQQRIWFQEKISPENPMYTVTAHSRLRGSLDVPALARALTTLVERHEALRTILVPGDSGEALQLVTEPAPVEVGVTDLARTGRVANDEIQRRIAEESARPLRLDSGPLLRARVLRLADDDNVLVLSIHHAACDGWSLGVLMREIGVLYTAFRRGERSPLAPLPVQYVDFTAWQRAWLNGPVHDRLVSYWRRELQGAPPTSEFPPDRSRPVSASYRGASCTFGIEPALAMRLAEFARQSDATLFMCLLAAFQLLLARYADQPDVMVGVPVAGRSHPALDGVAGLFVNVLPMRAQVEMRQHFRHLLAQVRQTSLGAYAHQELPFDQIVDVVGVDRELGRNPLVQVCFQLFQEQHAYGHIGTADDVLGMPGVPFGPFGDSGVATRFDVEVYLVEADGGLDGRLVYARDIFDGQTISHLAKSYVRLLESVAVDPDGPVGRLGLLGPAERQMILSEWNRTSTELPLDATIPALFEHQVDAAPGAVAVDFRAADGSVQRMSYASLEARANKLARHLRAAGVGPEARVGVCLPVSPDLLITLIAVAKVGGAYIPLDPGYPPARLEYMLADCGADIVVTTSSLSELVKGPSTRHVLLDAEAAAIASLPADRMPRAIGPLHLAYVIYTSGSTGLPKGVEVPHVAVVRLIHGADYAELGPQVRIPHLAPAAFDASTFEIWAALLHGGTSVLPARTGISLDEIAELSHSRGATTMWLTASLFNAAVDQHPAALAGIRQVLTGGEPLSAEHLVRARRALPETEFINGYGPTETTTFACCYSLPQRFDPGASATVPVGRPIANTTAYVLDNWMNPLPPGAIGELYIGGLGVARGYARRPGLTAERFVASPFGPPGARLYRSGDRARYRHDGLIECLGRMDRQVKVRGFRVEPAEVEVALTSDPAVTEAVVTAQPDGTGGSRLTAYVVTAAGTLGGSDLGSGERRRAEDVALVADRLRRFLRTRFPPYMVPDAIVTLKALPLSANGKVDWEALPDPADDGAAKSAFVAPRSAAEQAVAEVWAEVLGVARVSVHDDFFRLGGHSLLAMRLMARIARVFEVEVPVRMLFDTRTVAGLTAALGDLRLAKAVTSAPLVRMDGGEPLSPSLAQQRLWFLDRVSPGNPFYNVSIACRMRGSLDAGALERALDALMRRHDALRTMIKDDGSGVPMAVLADPGSVGLAWEDLSGRADPLAAARFRTTELAEEPLSLETGPPLRARVLRLADNDHIFVLVLHHAAADGWSLGIAAHELSAFYAAFAEGKELRLEPPPVQYGDYARWQRLMLQGETRERLVRYWRHALDGAPEVLSLPFSRPRPPVPSYRGAACVIYLDASLIAELTELARSQGATLYMTLLAAFQLLLSRYSGQADVLVGTPTAGRRKVELEGLIGMFVNTLVIRARIDRRMTFCELLAQVRQTVLDAFDHQEMPFEQLVDVLETHRDISRNPLFQVFFGMSDNVDVTWDMPGLAVDSVAVSAAVSKFDLSLHITAEDGGLAAQFCYATDLFDASVIERMADSYGRLLRAAAARPGDTAGTLDVLSSQDQADLLAMGTGATVPVPDATVTSVIEATADEFPGAVAIEAGGQQISYRLLDQSANRLAWYLRDHGVGPETRVAVCMPRSIDLVVAMLAIWKAGGAYVPLDPEYPSARLALMLADSNASLMITSGEPPEALAGRGGRLVRLDEDTSRITACPGYRPSQRSGPDNLAYIVYTSGSTGQPKGVLITHRSFTNLLLAQGRAFGFGPGDRVSSLFGIGFDAALSSTVMPLAHGATVVQLRGGTPPVGMELERHLRSDRVTSVHVAPASLRTLSGTDLPDLRVVGTGTEMLDPSLIHDLQRPGRRVFNNYGPTESTVVSTMNECDQHYANSVPIGRPVANTRVYVLDENLNLSPPGVAGELYIGGIGLARGYAGRSGLTAERFVADPFCGVPGARMYRTGDLARWSADGLLEFAGRIDDQVKVRGFRIEPGEIEATLNRHRDVARAAVVAQHDASGGKRLVAFVVPAPESPALDAAVLRRYATANLPAYMVPAAFVITSTLPLTANGKLDRRRLPTYDFSGIPSGRIPRTSCETILCRLFAEVLGRSNVSIDDNFFDLGGHSIVAVQLISRARAEGLVLTLRDVFDHVTVADLAAVCAAEDRLLRD